MTAGKCKILKNISTRLREKSHSLCRLHLAVGKFYIEKFYRARMKMELRKAEKSRIGQVENSNRMKWKSCDAL